MSRVMFVVLRVSGRNLCRRGVSLGYGIMSHFWGP